jgi:NAD(P)-dependent dehydrogenase (short-subunit alcohol dehydrogenase family)
VFLFSEEKHADKNRNQRIYEKHDDHKNILFGIMAKVSIFERLTIFPMHNKKLALVTGATGAIGKSIARLILTTGKYRVLMVVRNEDKALKVKEEIVRLTGLHDIDYVVVDLSVKKQIYHFAEGVKEPVHILVNNAALTPKKRTETLAGIEMQFAANVLGYFWMTDAFTAQLKAGAPSRIINVASYWAGGLNLSDLEFRSRPYDNDTAYRQSKQADRMLTVAFAERLAPFHITVNVCHPGDVNSALSNSMGFGGHETPDQGAGTPVWLATSHEVEGITGKYFEHRRESACSFSRDTQGVEKLFGICSGY